MELKSDTEIILHYEELLNNLNKKIKSYEIHVKLQVDRLDVLRDEKPNKKKSRKDIDNEIKTVQTIESKSFAEMMALYGRRDLVRGFLFHLYLEDRLSHNNMGLS